MKISPPDKVCWRAYDGIRKAARANGVSIWDECAKLEITRPTVFRWKDSDGMSLRSLYKIQWDTDIEYILTGHQSWSQGLRIDLPDKVAKRTAYEIVLSKPQGVSIIDHCIALGTSSQSYNGWGSGRSVPSLSMLYTLQEHGLNAWYCLTGERNR